MKKTLLAFAVLAVLSALCAAQQAHENVIHCPAYLCWTNFDSYILVRNTTGHQVAVLPSFCFNGVRQAASMAVPVPAHQTIVLRAEDFVDTSSSDGVIAVELSFAGDPGSIIASIVCLYSGQPSISFEMPFRNPDQDQSSSLHSCAWFAQEYITAVFVKNTTGNQVTVSPVFWCGGQSKTGPELNLGPYQPGTVWANVIFSQGPACIGGVDLYCNGPAGSIVAVSVAARPDTGTTFVEELLPGTAGGIPTAYNLFVANTLAYTISAINTNNFQINQHFADTGDIPNFLALNGDRLFCVNSGSNNVQILSPATGETLAEIYLGTGVNPWAIAFASDEKAYVTGWLTDDVIVVNPTTLEVRGRIPLGEDAKSPQGLCVAEDKLYVTSVNFNFSDYSYGPGMITVVDTETDEITGTINTTQVNPQSIAYDHQGELYVVCTGDYTPENTGVVDVIDASTNQIVKSLSIGGAPGVIEIAPNGNAYLGDGLANQLYKIDVVANEVIRDSGDPITFGSAGSFASGLAAASNGYLYICSFNDDAVYILDTRTDGLIRTFYGVGDGPGPIVATD